MGSARTHLGSTDTLGITIRQEILTLDVTSIGQFTQQPNALSDQRLLFTPRQILLRTLMIHLLHVDPSSRFHLSNDFHDECTELELDVWVARLLGVHSVEVESLFVREERGEHTGMKMGLVEKGSGRSDVFDGRGRVDAVQRVGPRVASTVLIRRDGERIGAAWKLIVCISSAHGGRIGGGMSRGGVVGMVQEILACREKRSGSGRGRKLVVDAVERGSPRGYMIRVGFGRRGGMSKMIGAADGSRGPGEVAWTGNEVVGMRK